MKDILSRAVMKTYGRLHKKGYRQLVYAQLQRQIAESPQIQALFHERKIKAYNAHEPVRNTIDHPDLYITQIRYYRMYKFFKENYPDIFDQNTKILNVGDPSGNLLQVLGKQGTSVNIDQKCVDFINNNGISAVLGNAEELEFEDRSFDYIFCFQCLEHVPNPVRALNEFGRIARKKVFLSIPYVPKTNIYNSADWLKPLRESWKRAEPEKITCHIFEFSTEDFKNILSYTNLKYEDHFPIYYFDNDTFIRRILNRHIISYFNFFILKPKIIAVQRAKISSL